MRLYKIIKTIVPFVLYFYEIYQINIIASDKDNSTNCFAMLNDSLRYSASNSFLCYKCHDSNFDSIFY